MILVMILAIKVEKVSMRCLRITDNLIEGILQEKTTPELKKIALEKDNFLNMQEIGRTFLKDGSISIDEYKRILILD